MRNQVIIFVLGICTCMVSPAPQVYEATGILQPETRSSWDANTIASFVDVLPEITDVLQKTAADRARSRPFDPAFVERTITAFLPLSKKILTASAKAEGRAVRPEELEALNAAEAIMPPVFRFMDTIRKSNPAIFSPGSASQFRSSSSPSAGTYSGTSDAAGLGQYGNAVAFTTDVITDIDAVFQKLNSSPGRSDQSNPEFIKNMISAFLPLSKKILVASAKAEGRTVRQDELDRLANTDVIISSVFKFMEGFRQPNFSGTGSNPASSFQGVSPGSAIEPMTQPLPTAEFSTGVQTAAASAGSETVLRGNSPVSSGVIPYYQQPLPAYPSVKQGQIFVASRVPSYHVTEAPAITGYLYTADGTSAESVEED